VAHHVRNLIKNGPQTTPRAKSLSPEIPNNQDAEHFARNLKKILATRHQLLAGTIHFINLEKVRDRLEKAGKWTARASRIETQCSNIIRSRLDASDLFLCLPGPSFVIIFSQLQAEAARFKCGMLGEEIEQHLLGKEPEFADVRVETSVACLDQNDMVLEKINVREEAAAYLARSTANTDHDEKAFRNPWIITPPSDVSTPAECQYDWYYEQKPERPPHMSFLYLPMWHVQKKAVGTFLCVPSIPMTPSLSLVGDAIYEAAPAALVCELDCETLGRIVNDLNALLESGQRSMLCMSVHFETLAQSQARQKFISKCSELTPNQRSHLIMELVDLPEGAPSGRLAELLSILRPFARLINVRTRLLHSRMDVLASLKIYAVGIALGREGLSEEELLPLLSVYTHSANQAGLRTYGFELRSRSSVSAALGAGFDFLSGGVIGSAINAPSSAYRFEAADIYAELIAQYRHV
jgi:hypothetical protein